MLNVFINDEPVTIAANNLMQLCVERNIQKERVAIAVNQVVIPRSLYQDTTLNQLDVIDVITAMQGG